MSTINTEGRVRENLRSSLFALRSPRGSAARQLRSSLFALRTPRGSSARQLRSSLFALRSFYEGKGARRSRAAFSLIEVMMALVVVGGGLVAVFGLFPVGLGQGMDARSDMSQATFASTVLESIAANVRSIDNLEEWENVEKWWKVATRGDSSGGSANNFSKLKLQNAQKFAADSDFTLRTREKTMESDGDAGKRKALTSDHMNGAFGDACVWYVGQELAETSAISSFKDDDIILPPQFLIRIVKIERKAKYFHGIGSSSSKVDWDTYKYKTWTDNKYKTWTDNEEWRTSHPSSVNVRALEVNSDNDIDVSNSEDTSGGDVIRLPSRYLVSIVSSDHPFPQPYVDNPVFFQEYAFLHRP